MIHWLKGFFTFSGRASRSEFARIVFPLIGVFVLLSFGNAFLMRQLISDLRNSGATMDIPTTWWMNLTRLRFALPFLAVPVVARRLHDLGRSARTARVMLLAPFVLLILPAVLMLLASATIFPQTGLSDDGRGIGSAIIGVYLFIAAWLVNLIIVMVLAFKPSQPGPNTYGPNPREALQ